MTSTLVRDAYNESIRKLWHVFHAALATAENSTQESQALQRFRNGVRLAQKARDRAIHAFDNASTADISTNRF